MTDMQIFEIKPKMVNFAPSADLISSIIFKQCYLIMNKISTVILTMFKNMNVAFGYFHRNNIISIIYIVNS